MNMRGARVLVACVGITLPYIARLPSGIDWLKQYTDSGAGGWLLLGAFNAVAWVAILSASFAYQRTVSLLAPAILGFGFLAWAHSTLDLRADAQAAIALVFIPIYALLPIAMGAAIGYAVDRRIRQHV